MCIFFLTGLSGAGKSTLAAALQVKLASLRIPAEVIDGDVYRKTTHKDLGFSAADRRENIDRLAKLAHAKSLQGIFSIVAAINPFEDQRMELTNQLGAKIIWIRCNLSTLIERDTKGLYHKALLPDEHPDKIWNLTGVNDSYEEPQHADLVIDTTETSLKQSVTQLENYVLTILKIQAIKASN